MRLYLTNNDRYRIRLTNGDTVSCRWDDHALRFAVKGMRGDRIIVTDSITAVSPMTNGRTIVWTPLDDCFRDMHKGKGRRERKERSDSGSAWMHPYNK